MQNLKYHGRLPPEDGCLITFNCCYKVNQLDYILLKLFQVSKIVRTCMLFRKIKSKPEKSRINCNFSVFRLKKELQGKLWLFRVKLTSFVLIRQPDPYGLRVTVGAHTNARQQLALCAHKAHQALRLHQSTVSNVGFCAVLTLFITSRAVTEALGSGLGCPWRMRNWHASRGKMLRSVVAYSM